MSSLDDVARLREADPGGLLDGFLTMPAQLAESYGRAREGAGAAPGARSLTCCAMGGSAAAADAALAATADRLEVPAEVRRGYRLPPHCGPEDLVVCVSYSGDTEETVAAFREAGERGCRRAVVCAGGALAALAAEEGVPAYRIPRGLQPRAGLGHLTGATLGALAGGGLVPAPDEDVEEARGALEDLATGLGPGVPGNEAKDIAAWVGDRTPVVWGSEGVSAPAAWRWKCAFNENAKIPAFSSLLPELDHHEVAGWSAGHGRGFVLIVLREEGEHPTVGLRLRATLEALEPSGLEWREVGARGGSPLARVLSLMLLGDVVSTYHALARGVDPTPIEAIGAVKSRLAAREAP